MPSARTGKGKKKERNPEEGYDAQPRTLPFLDGSEQPDGYGTSAVLEIDDYDDSVVPMDLGEEKIDEFARLQQLEQELEQERQLIAKRNKMELKMELKKLEIQAKILKEENKKAALLLTEQKLTQKSLNKKEKADSRQELITKGDKKR